MFLIHDDDLELIDGIGDSHVSGYLASTYGVLIPRSAVTGNPPTTLDHGYHPEVQHRDTYISVW